MEEIWKTHPRYLDYEVSNLGYVRSNAYRSNGKIIKIHYKKSKGVNRAYVGMYLDGKMYNVQVSRAVAEVYLPDFSEDCKVLHLDNNPLNNRLDNLRCGTQSDNIRQCVEDGRYKKRTTNIEKILNIKHGLEDGLTKKEISIKYGYPYSTVCDIIRRDL